jgi:hypothetical protein
MARSENARASQADQDASVSGFGDTSVSTQMAVGAHVDLL